MSSNNGGIGGHHFTQIDGAIIRGPESASVTDIFEGQFIDPIVKSRGPLEPRFWKRYQNDSFDIVWGEHAMEGKHQEFTDYLNNNVLMGRIVFELEPLGAELNFLDVKVRIIDGYLVLEIYSKFTDAHWYLHDTSAHPSHCVRNKPYSVGLRIRQNCSDGAPADHYFMDNLKAYKRYLLKCAYSQNNIDSNFIRAAKVKRSKTLKPNKKVQKQNGKRTYYFSTSYDPDFPDIKACIKKHEKILEEDPELKELFPKGCFRVTERRDHKNLKKHMAPSRFKWEGCPGVEPEQDSLDGRTGEVGCWKCGE